MTTPEPPPRGVYRSSFSGASDTGDDIPAYRRPPEPVGEDSPRADQPRRDWRAARAAQPSSGRATVPASGPPAGRATPPGMVGRAAPAGVTGRATPPTVVRGAASVPPVRPSADQRYGGTTYTSQVTMPADPVYGGGIGPRSRAALEDERLRGAGPYGADPRAPYRVPGPTPDRLRRRKRRVQILAAVLCAGLLLPILGFGAAYAALDLPSPRANPQPSEVWSADGAVLGRFALENRREVKLADVPAEVQNAIIATEDPTFRENSGVSFRGTARAVRGLVTGNEDAGGGSTITQQYIKNAFALDEARTPTVKAKEIVLAIKMAQRYDKDRILELYLNTIYFGRGAYGIHAAAQAYFGATNLAALKGDPAKAAVLAAVIKDPKNFDPDNSPENAEGRWRYVLNRMVENGMLEKSTADPLKYPTVKKYNPKGNQASRLGSRGILSSRIRDELEKVGFDEGTLNTKGLRVTTTINWKYQAAAMEAAGRGEKGQLHGQPETMASALVAIEPGTGKVLAYYGGEANFGGFDLASNPHPAGSSFKPYVLAAAREAGVSIKSVWDGRSGQELPGKNGEVHNSERDNSCPRCNLIQSTVKSLNTVYWALTVSDRLGGPRKGPQTVAELAGKAGVRRLTGADLTGKTIEEQAPSVDAQIGIGQYGVTVVDHASGFATMAANGTYNAPYFIQQVKNADGVVVYDREKDPEKPAKTQAFSRETAADVTHALQQVVKAGEIRLGEGREDAAGKTGTQQYQNTDENSHAWMCGYTPRVAVAVWVGNKEKDAPLRDKNGRRVYGSGVPGRIWKAFLGSDALKIPEGHGEFPPPNFGGEREVGQPEPPPEPPPEPTTPPTDGLSPSPEPEPTEELPTDFPTLPGDPPPPPGNDARPAHDRPPPGRSARG